MRITFAVLNVVSALVLLFGVFGVVQPRFWALDVPAAIIALALLVSAVGLLARLPWALRALHVSAWVSFVLGLTIVSLIVINVATEGRAVGTAVLWIATASRLSL